MHFVRAGAVHGDIGAARRRRGVELRRARAQFLVEQYPVLQARGVRARAGRQHGHSPRAHVRLLRRVQLHGDQCLRHRLRHHQAHYPR